MFDPLSLQFGTLVEIGPAIGLQLMWDFDVSANLNFTYGATAHVCSSSYVFAGLILSLTLQPSSLKAHLQL